MRSTLLPAACLVVAVWSATAAAQTAPVDQPPASPLSTPMAPGEWIGPPGGGSAQLLTQGGQSLEQSAGGGQQAGGAGRDGGGQQDNVTNPAQNTTTFIVANEYYTLDGGNRINTTYTRFKYPIYGRRGSVLFEVPFVYYNFTATAPDLPHVGGLGDVKVQGSFNTWTSANKKLTVINFLEVFLPTADNAIVERQPFGNELTAFNLGTGKFVFGPGLGFVYAFAPNFIVAPLYFYEASAFGSEQRPEIRRGKFRLFMMYAWESGLYVLPEFQALTNYLTGNSDFYVAPEVGYNHKRTILYVKPGFGIDQKPGDRQWGLEVGGRV
jgi:hypothetical protein